VCHPGAPHQSPDTCCIQGSHGTAWPGINCMLVARRQEMFEQPDMPDAAFIEEMDALIPDMYTAPGGGGSPPSAPEDGSLPAYDGDGGGAQGAPGSTQSERPAHGGGVAAQAAQHDTSKQARNPAVMWYTRQRACVPPVQLACTCSVCTPHTP